MSKLARTIACAFVAALVAGCMASALPVQEAMAASSPAQVKSVAAKAVDTSSIKITWKVVKGAKGYKVSYSTNRSMKGAKTITVKGAKAKSKVVKSLKGCTKYYVKVRAFKGKALGKWSAMKSAKTAHVVGVPTCTKPATCTRCGARCGSAALGHDYANNICRRCGSAIVRPSVNDYSWDELKVVANEIAACASKSEAIKVAKAHNLTTSAGTLDGTQTKSVELTDGRVAAVQILGFWHDEKADGSGKAGITFGFKEALATREMNETPDYCTTYIYGDGTTGKAGNAGGWKASVMRRWMNDSADATSPLSLLPSDLAVQIAEVSKSTNNKGHVYDYDQPESVITLTADKLWLPSMAECYGKVSTQSKHPEFPEVYDLEGEQYQLYANLGVGTDSCSVLAKCSVGSASAVSWWLRSPVAKNAGAFVASDSNGSYFNDLAGSTDNYVSPCFCL